MNYSFYMYKKETVKKGEIKKETDETFPLIKKMNNILSLYLHYVMQT